MENSPYWAREHVEDVVLDIGGDVGALVLLLPGELHGLEIEVSPIGEEARRAHTAVLRRRAGGRTVFAAVYPELAAGEYRVWVDCPGRVHTVTIVGGEVAELDLARAPDQGEGGRS